VSEPPRRSPTPSWQPGRFVWPAGKTKLVLFGGIGTRTGDAERSFASLVRHLSERGGYDVRRDVLEATYGGSEVDGFWRPRPYSPPDTRRSLIELADAVAGNLEWLRDRLPDDTRLFLFGYSLGGVAALDGLTLAIARDRAGWHRRIGGLVTFAAPVRGCNAGPLMNWAWLATGELDPLGQAGRDLDARWNDKAEQQRLERRAAFVRAAGATLLTLADPNDAVVRPDESLLPAPGESREELLVSAQLARTGTLGHGALLDEPAVWRRVLSLVGPQEVGSVAPGDDPIESELDAHKKRMRSEGRIK
jgi:hypothetical protein